MQLIGRERGAGPSHFSRPIGFAQAQGIVQGVVDLMIAQMTELGFASVHDGVGRRRVIWNQTTRRSHQNDFERAAPRIRPLHFGIDRINDTKTLDFIASSSAFVPQSRVSIAINRPASAIPRNRKIHVPFITDYTKYHIFAP